MVVDPVRSSPSPATRAVPPVAGGTAVSERPKPPTSALGRWRDVAVWWVANAVLRCGSPWFQGMIEGSIKYGLRAAAEDERREQSRGQP